MIGDALRSFFFLIIIILEQETLTQNVIKIEFTN